MNKKYRQYIGLAVAVLMYYIIHEGAHLVVALAQGVFKQINFIGLGVQIDVFAERMSNEQMGFFCLAGPLATLAVGWLMVLLCINCVAYPLLFCGRVRGTLLSLCCCSTRFISESSTAG